jgi:hypothetical protein
MIVEIEHRIQGLQCVLFVANVCGYQGKGTREFYLLNYSAQVLYHMTQQPTQPHNPETFLLSDINYCTKKVHF